MTARGYMPEYGDEFYRGPEEIEGELKFASLGEPARKAADLMFEAALIAPSCDSPIEVQLGARLKLALPPTVTLKTQHWFGRYRMDFAILHGSSVCLFIECDGKKFHSTPEQRRNDVAKDAAAALAGIPLLRFTGSAIFRHPIECCDQIIKILGRVRG